MASWPKQPVIYEISTWVWLHELSARYKRPIKLGDVPAQEWDAIASLEVDAVWLMGVWERSPEGTRIASGNQVLLADFRRALPDFTPEDNVGSPYCVRRYVADAQLGGPEGLAAARRMLAGRGVRLVLDFVPNHVAPDHPWISDHPEYFIRGGADDLKRAPNDFFEAGGQVLAHGRDPYFPAWPDVAQLNAFNPGLRGAVVETLCDIAGQCDGMRCDMAMLLINRIFERTWGARAGNHPSEEFWREVLPPVRQRHPGVIFMAEAYWDMEWELQQQGFDFCYDKRLYDRLEHDGAESVRLHLCADLAYQDKLVRFIENHDEPRAAATFSPDKERAAAVVTTTLPGAKLLHEGQFEGRRVRLPVFLRRRPDEPLDADLQSFHQGLLKAINTPALREGEWRLCNRSGWPDNLSYLNLIAWCWRKGNERLLIIVNLSGCRSEARVHLPWDDLRGCACRLTDSLTGEVFDRDGGEMRDQGLYVGLSPWEFHFFRLA